MVEIRCKKCNRLLAKLNLPIIEKSNLLQYADIDGELLKELKSITKTTEIHGTAEIKCGKCGYLNTITI